MEKYKFNVGDLVIEKSALLVLHGMASENKVTCNVIVVRLDKQARMHPDGYKIMNLRTKKIFSISKLFAEKYLTKLVQCSQE
tara:strand:- start:218 stop:463 length:246 start_codon:yes stop_codon:yes gene_type:complete